MLLTRSPRSFYFSPPTDGGSGSSGDGDGDGGDGDSGDGSQGGSSDVDVADHLSPDRWIERHGDAQRALGALSQKTETLERENKEYRDEINEMKDKMPGEDEVVVRTEKIETLREDGILDTEDPTADDLIDALYSEREARRSLENRQTFNEVVEVTGANRAALEDLGADELPYEVKEVEDEDGGTRRVAFVETDEGEQEFEQYIRNEYPTLSDTILDGEASGDDSDDDSGSGPSVPDQPGAGGASGSGEGPTTSVDDYIQQENENRGRA